MKATKAVLILLLALAFFPLSLFFYKHLKGAFNEISALWRGSNQ